jgi:hypothetical protein
MHFGAVEDKSFEPLLANMAEWLIYNPEPKWLKSLIDAKMINYQQNYYY